MSERLYKLAAGFQSLTYDLTGCLRERADVLNEEFSPLLVELTALRVENERLRVDAERYRFFVSGLSTQWVDENAAGLHMTGMLGDAIDEAMKGERT